MGRPPLCVREIVDTGVISLDRLKALSPDCPGLSLDSFVFPKSLVWPMGFSFSSAIAQHTMTAVCRGAGLTRDMQLSDAKSAPHSLDRFGLATDDVCLFTRCAHRRLESRLQALDQGFRDVGVTKKCRKDVNGSLSGTAVGIYLVAGTSLIANAEKLAILLPGLLHSLDEPMSAEELMAVLGHVQRLHLLNRPLFSTLDHCYAHARRTPRTERFPISERVVEELACCIALSPLWSFDLTKAWCPTIIASDASPSYGFGICAWEGGVSAARRLGGLSDRWGDYVTLMAPHPGDLADTSKVGKPHYLHIPQSAF